MRTIRTPSHHIVARLDFTLRRAPHRPVTLRSAPHLYATSHNATLSIVLMPIAVRSHWDENHPTLQRRSARGIATPRNTALRNATQCLFMRFSCRRLFAAFGMRTIRLRCDATLFRQQRQETFVQFTVAHCHIVGATVLSQSKQHDEPRLEGEGPEAYDIRTWRSKLNIGVIDGVRTVVIPAHGMHQAIAAAAKYSKRQIPNQGKATWTKKFEAGIALLEDIPLNIDPDTVTNVVISANADGVRGSGKRVPRRFPQMPAWEAKFDVQVLDPIITESVFREMLEIAGMFIGIGRFRPEKGGTNGRFRVQSLSWTDNRRLAA